MPSLLTGGFFTVLRVDGVPLRVHWSLPVGMALALGLDPVAWVAYVGVVLIHELGHVWAVRGLGARVDEVGLSGFGGYCRWRGSVTTSGLGVIAWSGVGAQAVLLLTWLALWLAVGAPAGPSWAAAHHVLVQLNLLLIALNLLPIRGLDGADAWAAAREAWRRRRGVANLRPRRPRAEPMTPEEAKEEAERQAEVERVFQKMLQGLLPESRVDRRDDDE